MNLTIQMLSLECALTSNVTISRTVIFDTLKIFRDARVASKANAILSLEKDVVYHKYCQDLVVVNSRLKSCYYYSYHYYYYYYYTTTLQLYYSIIHMRTSALYHFSKLWCSAACLRRVCLLPIHCNRNILMPPHVNAHAHTS